MKCNSISDKGTVNCRKAFRCPSCTRQSYLVRQYTTSSRRYARSVPYRQPAPGISSGQRTRSSLARRSASVASGIRMVKGVSSKTISRPQQRLACLSMDLLCRRPHLTELLNPPTFGCELDRIGQEVQDDLTVLALI